MALGLACGILVLYVFWLLYIQRYIDRMFRKIKNLFISKSYITETETLVTPTREQLHAVLSHVYGQDMADKIIIRNFEVKE